MNRKTYAQSDGHNDRTLTHALIQRESSLIEFHVLLGQQRVQGQNKIAQTALRTVVARLQVYPIYSQLIYLFLNVIQYAIFNSLKKGLKS